MAIILSHFTGQNFPTMLTKSGSDNFIRLQPVFNYISPSLSFSSREICRVNGNDERSPHNTGCQPTCANVILQKRCERRKWKRSRGSSRSRKYIMNRWSPSPPPSNAFKRKVEKKGRENVRTDLYGILRIRPTRVQVRVINRDNPGVMQHSLTTLSSVALLRTRRPCS